MTSPAYVERDRAIVAELRAGATTHQVAARFGIAATRVSTIRRDLEGGRRSDVTAAQYRACIPALSREEEAALAVAVERVRARCLGGEEAIEAAAPYGRDRLRWHQLMCLVKYTAREAPCE